MANPRKYRVKGKTLGIYYGEQELSRYEEVQRNADRFSLHPSDYGRRLVQIGQRMVLKNPALLLENV